VKTTPLVRRLTVASVFSFAPIPSLVAQNVVIAEHAGAIHMVRGASGARPVIELDGVRTKVDGYRVGLKPVDNYLPVFVSVRDVNVTASYLAVEDSGSEINNKLQFRARLESPFPLDNVFVVLDLRGEQAGRIFFLYEVGRLEPRESKLVSVVVPMSFPLGSGHFKYHIFVDGMEALHSGIPEEEREAALDRMINERIKSVTDEALALFVGPEPEYPDSLRKAKIKGQAVVTVRVSARGRPLEPTVKEATDPAFGEAALAAVRLWRFLPVVRNGRPVETSAEIPFVFAPPAGK